MKNNIDILFCKTLFLGIILPINHRLNNKTLNYRSYRAKFKL